MNVANKIKSKKGEKKFVFKSKAFLAMQRCVGFIELFGKPLGWKMNYEWKSNILHYCTISWICFCILQCLYSLLKYFNNGEYRRIFHVVPVLGVASVRAFQAKCFVSSVNEITALLSFSYKLCRQSFGRSSDELEKRQNHNLKIFKCILSIATASTLAYLYYPITSFIFEHKLVQLLPIEIMFIDQSKMLGFVTANAVMIVMGTYSAALGLYMSSHYIGVVLNISMQVDLIEADFAELNELWSDATTLSVAARHSLLRTICQKCQDKDNYIAKVDKIFGETVFYFFSFAYLAQIVCLYMIKAENWIPGLGIACGLLLEMLLYSLIGTGVTINNERLCYMITQSNWYTYDIHSQKILLLLLHSCMNAKELWIGPFAPLSVSTATEIVKSIYSYYTVLVEVM